MTWQILGAVLTGVVLLGAAIRSLPALWGFAKAAAKVPHIIEGISQEFGTNGGASMRDSIDRLEAHAASSKEWQESHAGEDMARHAATASELAEQTEYVHKRMHDLLNRLTPLTGFMQIFDRRMTVLERLAEETNVKLTAAEAARPTVNPDEGNTPQ